MNAQDMNAAFPGGPATPASETPSQTSEENISAWQMLGGSLTMLAIGVFVFFQLARLERGDVESVHVWTMAAAAYKFLGFWPAVSICPALSLYMASLAWRRSLETMPGEYAA